MEYRTNLRNVMAEDVCVPELRAQDVSGYKSSWLRRLLTGVRKDG